jgi:hypothetical protein
MKETYTYTARSRQNPDEMITFTIDRQYLRINPANMAENLSKIAAAEDRKQASKEQFQALIKPTALTLFETWTGPIHIGDVHLNLSGSEQTGLTLTAWKRLAGLRLAPFHIHIKEVDNPDAALAFAEEVNNRKQEFGKPGAFFGPLDYWLGWLGGLLAFIIFVRWRKKNKNSA